MLPVFAVIHLLLAAGLVTLILMHSGRDTGLGGMGFTPQSQGGTHIVERNLTRLTVIIGILLTANTIALSHLPAWPPLPHETRRGSPAPGDLVGHALERT